MTSNDFGQLASRKKVAVLSMSRSVNPILRLCYVDIPRPSYSLTWRRARLKDETLRDIFQTRSHQSI